MNLDVQVNSVVWVDGGHGGPRVLRWAQDGTVEARFTRVLVQR